MTDDYYMKRALGLAENGKGKTWPNPMVGAVIVKDNEIIAEGWHERYGELHAERHALKNCNSSPEGATMYVTLEPCSHYGKQPPCTEAIVEAKIKRVCIGTLDPNPLVAGKGIEMLKQHGVEVVYPILPEPCQKINEIFFHYIQTKRPYVLMKYAMTLDGKIATHTGLSKWITGEVARRHVHQTRNLYQGILVGVQTILADDPMLTCRLENGKNPLRVICDTTLRTPITSQIVRTASEIPTIIATASQDDEKIDRYRSFGCEVIVLPVKDEHLDLGALLDYLGAIGIASLLVEGGATINWSFLKEGLVNKVHAYLAPKLFGGKEAKSPIGGVGVTTPDEAILLKNQNIIALGDDLLIEAEVIRSCLQD